VQRSSNQREATVGNCRNSPHEGTAGGDTASLTGGGGGQRLGMADSRRIRMIFRRRPRSAGSTPRSSGLLSDARRGRRMTGSIHVGGGGDCAPEPNSDHPETKGKR